MSALPVPHLSVEEYLRIDRDSSIRHEYLDGVVYAMAGGSYNHATIIGNLTRVLGNLLLPRGCNVTPSDARVRVAPEGPFFFPDIVVIGGQPHFADEHGDTVTNPVLIVEVLSPTTESYDRILKFDQFRRIASLREYLLVSQTEQRIQSYSRQADENWLFSEFLDSDAGCRADQLGITVEFADIYRNVTLPSRPA